MPIIITFSCLVGTGKSVCSKFIASELFKKGLPVYYIRFRQVSPKSFFKKKKQITEFKFKESVNQPVEKNGKPRFENFRLRSNLFFVVFMFYFLWKSYLFFILIKFRYSKDIVITDRYIYDNLVHFKLDRKKQWGIYRFFEGLLPKPTLPFILYSDFDTIKNARPDYWPQYIHRNLENYRYLNELFPKTIFIEANQINEKALAVYSTVENYLNGG